MKNIPLSDKAFEHGSANIVRGNGPAWLNCASGPGTTYENGLSHRSPQARCLGCIKPNARARKRLMPPGGTSVFKSAAVPSAVGGGEPLEPVANPKGNLDTHVGQRPSGQNARQRYKPAHKHATCKRVCRQSAAAAPFPDLSRTAEAEAGVSPGALSAAALCTAATTGVNKAQATATAPSPGTSRAAHWQRGTAAPAPRSGRPSGPQAEPTPRTNPRGRRAQKGLQVQKPRPWPLGLRGPHPLRSRD